MTPAVAAIELHSLDSWVRLRCPFRPLGLVVVDVVRRSWPALSAALDAGHEDARDTGNDFPQAAFACACGRLGYGATEGGVLERWAGDVMLQMGAPQ